METRSVVVRPARVGDLDAVVGLEVTCLGRDAWSEGLLREALSGDLPTVTVLVAEVAEVAEVDEVDEVGGVVGHAVASVVDDVAELQRLATAPARRRTGVATALLRGVLGVARDAERVLLEVREDNVAALAFYDAAGFVELARRPRYYADGATAVVLERDLGIRPG